MKTHELVAALQSHLDAEFPDVPVLVSGGETRPVPSIFIENWQIEPMQLSMSNYLTSQYDDSGNETARVYQFPYELRVSMTVRHNDDVAGSKLHGKLRQELMKLSTRPERLSGSVSQVKMGGGGGIEHQFVNPSESEFSQAAMFTTSQTFAESDLDTVENIITNVDIIE